MTSLTCQQCSKTFEHSARGRRPNRCPECRGIKVRHPQPTKSPTIQIVPAKAKRTKPIETSDPTGDVAMSLGALAAAMLALSKSIDHLLREWPL